MYKNYFTLYDPGGGGLHAFNYEAALLCFSDFSQKNSLTPCGEKTFD